MRLSHDSICCLRAALETARERLHETIGPSYTLNWLLLGFMGAMLGVVVSGNLVQLVVFWELTSISSFLLIGYWYHRGDARASGPVPGPATSCADPGEHTYAIGTWGPFAWLETGSNGIVRTDYSALY